MSKVLLKYKELSILVDENADMELFTKNVEHIYRFFEQYKAYVSNLMDATEEDTRRLTQMKDELSEFIEDSGVIGAPFDNHDALLYALDRNVDYKVLEIHGNTGKANAAKEEVKQSQIQMRVSTSQKAAWVKAAQKEGVKLTEWITMKCNR